MGYKIAVAGATGMVGREILTIMAERGFPADEVTALAARRALGTEVSYGDATLTTRDIEAFDFAGIDIALFADGADSAKLHGLRATKAGAVMIDGSDAFRLDPAVPLVVPEVNPAEVERYTGRNIIASPSPATAQLAVVLGPLHTRARVKRAVVTSLHAVSDLGKAAMDELWDQTKGLYVPGQERSPDTFPRQIAFNLIPQVGSFMEDGTSAAEWAIMAEMKKILGPGLRLNATCVQAPVFAGHAQTVNVEFEDFLDEDEARDLLRESPGIMVIDKAEDGGYVTPVEAVGDFATFVSRIRQDSGVENGLSLWCAADNLRKGAALNMVQIAELLGTRCLRKG